MNYKVFLVNADGSGSLIGQLSSLAEAVDLANSQTSGATSRIEFGNEAESTVIEYIEVP
jgi:hypothetical protein